jgi:ABC-type multidrug transport system permease subunit
MNNWLRNSQLPNLIGAQFREILREPGILFWGIIFPILMSLGLGIAFTKKTDITRKVAVVNNTLEVQGHDSLNIVSRFLHEYADTAGQIAGSSRVLIPDEKLGNTTLIFQQKNWDDAIVQLKRGTLAMILEENEGRVVYHFDPLNPDAQLTFLKLTALFDRNGKSSRGHKEEITPLTLIGTRYIDFFIPGLIAMNIMTACLWGISYSMIEKRSKKLLRRMVATPMRKSNFLISLITVRMIMNFVEASLLLLFAWLVFDITIQGNVPALIVLFLAGNFAFAGIAVTVSCRTGKTEIGNGLINAVTLPMMVLSGVFFSYYNFPEWAIPYIQKFPLTLLADGIRSIFIEGASFSTTAWPSFVLALIGVFFFTIGLRFFKWH